MIGNLMEPKDEVHEGGCAHLSIVGFLAPRLRTSLNVAHAGEQQTRVDTRVLPQRLRRFPLGRSSFRSRTEQRVMRLCARNERSRDVRGGARSCEQHRVYMYVCVCVGGGGSCTLSGLSPSRARMRFVSSMEHAEGVTECGCTRRKRVATLLHAGCRSFT